MVKVIVMATQMLKAIRTVGPRMEAKDEKRPRTTGSSDSRFSSSMAICKRLGAAKGGQ